MPSSDLKYDAIIAKLKSKNIKITDIRSKIIKLIVNNYHLTMQQIIEELQKSNKSINVMSVYNTIDLLLEEHILFSNTFDGKNIQYELSADKTIHIKCDDCGEVKHLTNEQQMNFDLSNVRNLINDEKIKIEHVKIEIHVKCLNCNKST